MPTYSDRLPDNEEHQAPVGRMGERLTVMDLALEADRNKTRASYNTTRASVPFFTLAAVALLLILIVAGGITVMSSGSGSSPDAATDNGPQVTIVPKVTMQPAATEIPAATAVPTPVGIALTSIGKDKAQENKVVMDCKGQQLVFSLMLRSRAEDNRLEVTLMTNAGSNAIDAIYKNRTGTILVPGTTCGTAVSWDGSSASYTVVQQ